VSLSAPIESRVSAVLVAAVVLGEYRTVSLSAPVDRQPRYLSLRFANEQDNDGRGTDSWQAPLCRV